MFLPRGNAENARNHEKRYLPRKKPTKLNGYLPGIKRMLGAHPAAAGEESRVTAALDSFSRLKDSLERETALRSLYHWLKRNPAAPSKKLFKRLVDGVAVVKEQNTMTDYEGQMTQISGQPGDRRLTPSYRAADRKGSH